MHVVDIACQKNTIRFCPKCGQESLLFEGKSAIKCTQCQFLYYHNAATTADVLIRVGSEVLLAYRAVDPQKGTLDYPGGFVECGERAEEALVREIQEELKLTVPIEDLRFVCSVSNQYPYSGLIYHTVDIIFEWVLDEKPQVTAHDDVEKLEWFHRKHIPDHLISFDCMRQCLSIYNAQLDAQGIG